MKKVITKIGVETIEVNGLRVHTWTKRCPCCKREYTTTSRSQKFCSLDCQRKYAKKKSEQKKVYEEIKPIERLRSRSHSLAVDFMNQLSEMGLVEKKCACCGSVESLQVHHKDLRWMNNNPENLQWLCNTCHSKVHSDFDNDLKNNNQTIMDKLSEVEYEFYSKVLK